jgi:hypothetical protein
MDVKKILKLFYTNGTSGGGNKGVLPEKGKRTSLVPKRPFGERLNLISDLANIDEMKGKETYLNDVYDDIKGRLIEEASKGEYSWSVTELELISIAVKHYLSEWCGTEQLLVFLKVKCMEDDIRVNITDYRLDLYRIVEFSWNK